MLTSYGYIAATYSCKQAGISIMLLFHGLNGTVAMYCGGVWVETVNEIKVIQRCQCLLVLDDDQLVCKYGSFQLGKSVFIDVV